jgi:protocatechuate 3,4-dioxygenase beta subunit
MKYNFLNFKRHFLFGIWAIICFSCQSQTSEENKEQKQVGGPCEGCEAIYEYGDRYLTSIDTLPGFFQYEPQLIISGQVLMVDEKTPAKDVILYIYHTNPSGIYETKGDEKGWAKRHGYIRSWAKTDDNGKYTFYTFRPGAYPNRKVPQHIHITVKEPDKNEYYIEGFFFDDDPLLTEEQRKNLRHRGGSGIVTINQTASLLEAKRDIILGKNIPDYE